MFRKSDFKRRVLIARACPWSEPVKKITPVDKNGSIMEQVSFVPETCEARSQVQLDPADVNITSLIKNGMRIDPASCLAYLKENGMTRSRINTHTILDQ